MEECLHLNSFQINNTYHHLITFTVGNELDWIVFTFVGVFLANDQDSTINFTLSFVIRYLLLVLEKGKNIQI